MFWGRLIFRPMRRSFPRCCPPISAARCLLRSVCSAKVRASGSSCAIFWSFSIVLLSPSPVPMPKSCSPFPRRCFLRSSVFGWRGRRVYLARDGHSGQCGDGVAFCLLAAHFVGNCAAANCDATRGSRHGRAARAHCGIGAAGRRAFLGRTPCGCGSTRPFGNCGCPREKGICSRGIRPGAP